MSPSSTTSTILIVDHDPATLSMKRRLLSRQSYRIIEAGNGTDALMLATVELPDLVLLDANLPDIDTFDACRRIKTQSENQFVKILQISATRMNAPDRMKGLEIGADTYLVEPADEELIGTVRALLKLAKQERDNIRLAEKLSRAERQLSVATEAAHCLIWDWDITADRVEWSGRIERWAGPSGSCGGTMRDFIDLLHPDDRPKVRQKLEQAMAERAIDYADEYRFPHLNGNVQYLHAGGRFHYDSQGKAVRLTGIVQDMTERKRAEIALRESEERLMLFIEHAPTAIAMLDREMRYLAVSHRFKEDYRIAGDPIGQSHYVLFPEIPEHWKEVHRRGLEGQILKADADPFVRPDGTTQYVKWEVRPWYAADGAIGGILIAAEEVTARVRAAYALHESEALQSGQKEAFEAAMTDAPLQVSLAALVRTAGRHFGGEAKAAFYLANDEGSALTHVVGMSDAYARSVDGIKIGRESLSCGLAMHRGEPVITPDVTHDSRWQPWLWLAQEHNYRACWSFPLRPADGPVLGALDLYFNESRQPTPHDLELADVLVHAATIIVSRYKEISQRARMERTLRESEARFRTMAEAVPSFLFETDAEGWNTWTSEGWCRFTGQTPAQVSGHGWAEALHPEDRAANIDRWLQCMKDGVPFEAQQRLRRTDGSYAWVIARALPVRDDQGRISRWVGSVTDVDAIVRAEEGQARLAAIVESTDDAIIGKDAQGIITSWNRGAETLLGYTAAEAIGRPVTMLFPPDRASDEQAILDRLKKGESIRQYETVRRRKDGRNISVSLTISPIRDKQGRVIGASKILRDITARKRADEQLRESHRFISEMTSVLPGVLYIFDLQEQRNIYVNRHTGAVLGYSEEEVHALGKDFIPTILHPDDAIRLLQHYESFEELEDGIPAQIEYRFRHRDGSYRWFLSRDVVWHRSADGHVRQILGMATDITERKQGEEALRESEARFRNVFKHAGTGIAIAEPDGSFVQCNPAYCAMLGYTEDELGCLRFQELIHPEDRAGNVAGIARLIAGELPYFEVENRYVDKNGEPVWAHKFVSLLRDHAGQPKYLVALVTNVTDRRKAEHDLREAQGHLQRWNIELEQAVNEKTMELRQSQGRLRALASELNLAEQRERKRIATELHDHLQQTLVLGKLTMGQGKRLAAAMPACLNVMKKADDIFSEALTYTRTLVAELSPPVLRDQGLAAGLKWLGGYMQKYHLTVAVTVPEAMELKIPEDQSVLLFQSVRELLMNAWKHAGTGKAAVVLAYTDDRLRITVSDKGAGFDLAAVAAAKPSGGGGVSSKFGLFSIEERMQSLGGSFELHSAPGQGTTAMLSLPLARHRETKVKVQAESPERSFSSTLQPPASRIRVLLVDDHAMVRQGLRAMLEGYEDVQIVGEAVDGQDAIRLTQQFRPEIVVMDINMPKMTGIQATREITTRYPDVTVIGLSVNAGDDNHGAMTKAGAVRLMTKEAAVEQLYDVIQAAVKKSSGPKRV